MPPDNPSCRSFSLPILLSFLPTLIVAANVPSTIDGIISQYGLDASYTFPQPSQSLSPAQTYTYLKQTAYLNRNSVRTRLSLPSLYLGVYKYQNGGISLRRQMLGLCLRRKTEEGPHLFLPSDAQSLGLGLGRAKSRTRIF